MTAALPAAVDQALAKARHDLAEYVSGAELALTSHDSRDVITVAMAVELLEDYGSDLQGLAYLAAEAIAQLVPPVQPLPPAAADIRLAHDYPGFGGEDADRARRHADADLRGGR